MVIKTVNWINKLWVKIFSKFRVSVFRVRVKLLIHNRKEQLHCKQSRMSMCILISVVIYYGREFTDSTGGLFLAFRSPGLSEYCINSTDV